TNGRGWGMYSDVQHEAGARYSWGLEIAVKNKGSNVINDPYNGGPIGLTQGIWLAGGGDNTYGGSAANPSSVAILVGKNAHTWNKGICFLQDGITGAIGTSGTGTAIAFGRGHMLEWYASSGVPGYQVYSDVSAAADKQLTLINTNGLSFQNASSINNFRIAN